MKLTAIALTFTIPLVVTTFFLVKEQSIKIAFAAQESRGNRYLQRLSRMLVHLELHLALARQNDAQTDRTEAVVDTASRSCWPSTTTSGRPCRPPAPTSMPATGGSAVPARLKAAWESVKLATDASADDVSTCA